jgi:hypothetical protein
VRVEKVTQFSRKDWRVGFDSPGDLRAGERHGKGRIRSMNWFRSNIRPWTWLPLFALALQTVVSFGHIHRDDLNLPPLTNPDQTQKLDAKGAPRGLADQHHHSAPNHDCPICASIALLGTGAPAWVPVLVVPLLVARFSPSEKPIYRLRPQFALSFQARGPPII